MTGKGHLVFGMCAGITTAILTDMPLTSTNVAVGIAAVAIAALAPDLDEPNSLLGKRLSINPKTFKMLVAIVGIILIASAFFAGGITGGIAIAAGAGTFFVSHMLKSKASRGIVMAAVGSLLVAFGFMQDWYWLICLGVFVGVAPWTPHRSVTHTIWAVALWYYIGSGFENAINIDNMRWLITVAYASHLVADSLTVDRVKWLLGVTNKRFGIPLIRVGHGSSEAIVNGIAVALTIAFLVTQTAI